MDKKQQQMLNDLEREWHEHNTLAQKLNREHQVKRAELKELEEALMSAEMALKFCEGRQAMLNLMVSAEEGDADD